ncbi:MAG: hypothetical protein OXB86_04950 [Bdellovibrionales bacterium]|nr:hypothetical protein [Bdellovibrionales bacterium]
MKKLFIVLIGLFIFSPFAYSKVDFESLTYSLMEHTYQKNKFGFPLTHLFKRTEEHKKSPTSEIIYTSVDEEGNNILHFLFNSNPPKILRENEFEFRILNPRGILGAIFSKLGQKRFIKLLLQKNKKGVSPLDQVKASGGLPYRALRSEILKRQDILYNIKMVTGMVSGSFVLTGIAFSKSESGDLNLTAAVVVALGLSLCYLSFFREGPFLEQLDQTIKEIKSEH